MVVISCVWSLFSRKVAQVCQPLQSCQTGSGGQWTGKHLCFELFLENLKLKDKKLWTFAYSIYFNNTNWNYCCDYKIHKNYTCSVIAFYVFANWWLICMNTISFLHFCTSHWRLWLCLEVGLKVDLHAFMLFSKNITLFSMIHFIWIHIFPWDRVKYSGMR